MQEQCISVAIISKAMDAIISKGVVQYRAVIEQKNSMQGTKMILEQVHVVSY